MRCPKCEEYMNRVGEVGTPTDGYRCDKDDLFINFYEAREILDNLDRFRKDIRELNRCGVPYTITEDKNLKHITGKIGDFTFTNGGRGYWTVNGPVPLHVAWYLYNDGVGRTDIRVSGHCGCPEPAYPWPDYYDWDGLQLYIKHKDPAAQKRDEEHVAVL